MTRTPQEAMRQEFEAWAHSESMPLVSMWISVGGNDKVTSDVQTHDNSYADVSRGLAIIKGEIERVFVEQKSCPHYPANSEQAKRPIVRSPAALRAQPEAEAQPAQPVAWLCEWDNWLQYHDASDPLPSKWDDEVPKITPLYAAPQPAQEGVAGEPLQAFGVLFRVDGDILRFADDSARAATEPEKAMWRALSAPQPSPKTGEGSAIGGVPDLAEHYRKAIAQVCEGWTLPDGARKTLEAALWSPPPAAAAPSGSQEKRNG